MSDPIVIGPVRLSAVFAAMFMLGFGTHLVSIPLSLLLFTGDRFDAPVHLLRQLCYTLMAFGAFGVILFQGALGMPAEIRLLVGLALFFIGVRAADGLRRQIAGLRR